MGNFPNADASSSAKSATDGWNPFIRFDRTTADEEAAHRRRPPPESPKMKSSNWTRNRKGILLRKNESGNQFHFLFSPFATKNDTFDINHSKQIKTEEKWRYFPGFSAFSTKISCGKLPIFSRARSSSWSRRHTTEQIRYASKGRRESCPIYKTIVIMTEQTVPASIAKEHLLEHEADKHLRQKAHEVIQMYSKY